MNVAELTVEALIANGIDQLYCLPGVQNDDFFNALYDRQDELIPIHARHEQGAAYMATGAAMATGKPQACCIVPGPGFLNASAALCTAYAVNAPVFTLVGQIPLGAIGKGHGLLHEIQDQLAILSTLTKSVSRIESGDNAARQFREAFSNVQSGRPRPVGVEVPVNVWTMPVEDESVLAVPDGKPEISEAQIAAASDLLANASCPMIIVGSGAQDHGETIRQLAEMIDAPVLAFRNGHGVIPADHPKFVTMPTGHDLWPMVDVVIGLGTRLQSQQMPWGMDDKIQVIHIDVDEQELGRFRQPEVSIHADLSEALPMLMTSLQGKEATRSEWMDQVEQSRVRRAAQFADRLAPQLAWLQAIRAELPHDGIFVDELTQVGYVSRFAFPAYQPRTFLSTGYQGTLGYGFATALGAAHARRDVPVVAIAGDGGALFTISELATAVRHNIPVNAIIFNDQAFGNVRRLQMDNYEGRCIATDLTSPDFVKLAESFGAQGLKATTPEELRKQLRTAFKHPGPSIIEVPVGELPSPWEFVLMPKVRG